MKVFNGVLRRQYFPPELEHLPMLPILKTGKEPMLASFYRPVSTPDIVDKFFEKILLTRVFREVNEHWLLLD